MLYTICGWYSFVLLIISLALVIAKDGTSTTSYTGKYKLTHILAHLPIYYFIVVSLFYR